MATPTCTGARPCPWRCEACGERCDTLAVHHVIPVSAGGPELPPIDELLAVCADCHRRLG